MMRVPFRRRAIEFRAIDDVAPKPEPPVAAFKLVDPKPEPPAAAFKLVDPKPEPPAAACKLVAPKPEPPAITKVEPTIDLLSNDDSEAEFKFEEDSQRWDDSDGDCKCTDCSKTLTKATAFPKTKDGREWCTDNIHHRCESCWRAHKGKLLGLIKNNKKRKGANKKTKCEKCGNEHTTSSCYLKKGSLVEVIYDGKWWNAKILFCHRMKNKVTLTGHVSIRWAFFRNTTKEGTISPDNKM